MRRRFARARACFRGLAPWLDNAPWRRARAVDRAPDAAALPGAPPHPARAPSTGRCACAPCAEEEVFGFDSDSDDSYVKYEDGDALLAPGTTQQPAGAGVDAMTINMLRKKAELVAARRRAAELNVKLLASQNPGGGGRNTPGQRAEAINRLAVSQAALGGAVDLSQRDAHQMETRVQAEAQMAEMQNTGLLAGWKAQLQELDRLRMLSPEGSHLMDKIEQQRRERLLKIEAYKSRQMQELGRPYEDQEASGVPMAGGVTDPTVSRLYDDIGVYTDRAAKARQSELTLEKEEARLLADELALREEESRMKEEAIVTASVAADIKRMILTLADKIVTRHEVAVAERETSIALANADADRRELENQLSGALAEKNEKERRLAEISNVMRPIAGLLGGGAPSVYQSQPATNYSSANNNYSSYAPTYASQNPYQSSQAPRANYEMAAPRGQAPPWQAPAPQSSNFGANQDPARQDGQWWNHGRQPAPSASPANRYDRAPPQQQQQQQQQQSSAPPPPRRYSLERPPQSLEERRNSFERRNSLGQRADGRRSSLDRQHEQNPAYNSTLTVAEGLYARIPGDDYSEPESASA